MPKLRCQKKYLMCTFLGFREGTIKPIPLYQYELVDSPEDAYRLLALVREEGNSGGWVIMRDDLLTGQLEPVLTKASCQPKSVLWHVDEMEVLDTQRGVV